MKLFLPIFFILFSFLSNSQDFGYFGKKNVLSINTVGRIPIFYVNRMSPEFFNVKNGKLKNGKYSIDYGLSIALSHAFSGKFAFGAELNLEYAKIEGPHSGYTSVNDTNGYSHSYTFYYDHESLLMQTISFIPKVEYTLLGKQLPFGFINQFGIGYTNSRVLDKDYVVELKGTHGYPIGDQYFDQEKILNPKRKSISGLTLLYAFNIRTPISKRLMINYGLKYTWNFTFYSDSNYNSSSQKSAYISDKELKNYIRNKRLNSLIALTIGISYAF